MLRTTVHGVLPLVFVTAPTWHANDVAKLMLRAGDPGRGA